MVEYAERFVGLSRDERLLADAPPDECGGGKYDHEEDPGGPLMGDGPTGESDEGE